MDNRYNFTNQSILEKAQGNWPKILQRAGINLSFLKNKHGPCPVCGGRDRFRFDDKEGRGTFYCNKCGAGTGIDLIKLYRNCDFYHAIDMVSEALGMKLSQNIDYEPKPLKEFLSSALQKTDEEATKYRRKQLNNVWQQAKNITKDDAVDRYLKTRGITIEFIMPVLRLHSCLPYYDDDRILIGKFPALLAKVQNSMGTPVALHRTYLESNGCKANVPEPKKIMPSKAGVLTGAAIRLFEPIDGILALAEGIETALAFYSATKVPIWSTINAYGMEKIILPPEVKEVIIAADNDVSGRGQEAAEKLKRRLVFEGKSVKIVMPPNAGQDFNDLLLEAAQ